jgi:hypothetical protein
LLAALVVAVVILPESADPTAARVDTAGTLLGAGALAAFAFAIISSESAGFGSAEVIALLCASAVLFAAFIWREHRAEHPLLDLRFPGACTGTSGWSETACWCPGRCPGACQRTRQTTGWRSGPRITARVRLIRG